MTPSFWSAAKEAMKKWAAAGVVRIDHATGRPILHPRLPDEETRRREAAALAQRRVVDFAPPFVLAEAERVAVWIVHRLDGGITYYLDGLDETGIRKVRLDVTEQATGTHGLAFKSGWGAIREGPSNYFWGVYYDSTTDEWRVVRWRRAGSRLVNEEFVGILPKWDENNILYRYLPSVMFFTSDGTLHVPTEPSWWDVHLLPETGRYPPYGALTRVAPKPGGGWDIDFETFYPHAQISEVYRDYATTRVYAPGRWLRPLAARPTIIVAFEPIAKISRWTGLTGTPSFAFQERLVATDSRLPGYCPPYQGKLVSHPFTDVAWYDRHQGLLAGYAWGNAVWRLSGSEWSALVNDDWTTVTTDWVLWYHVGAETNLWGWGDSAPDHVFSRTFMARAETAYLPTLTRDTLYERCDADVPNHSWPHPRTVRRLSSMCNRACVLPEGGLGLNAGMCFCPDQGHDCAPSDTIVDRSYSIDPGQNRLLPTPWQGDTGGIGAALGYDAAVEADANRYWMISYGVMGTGEQYHPLGLYSAPIRDTLLPGEWELVYEEPDDPNPGVPLSGWNRRPELAVTERAVWLLEGRRTLGGTDNYERILRIDKETGEQVELERRRQYEYSQMFRAWRVAWK